MMNADLAHAQIKEVDPSIKGAPRMPRNYIALMNPQGVVRYHKLGFSWTVLFFGALVYAFRSQWSEFAKMFFLTIPTAGIYAICQIFTANKKTVVYHLERGYKPATEEDAAKLLQRHIIG